MFLSQMHLLIDRYQESIHWGRQSLRGLAELAIALAELEEAA